MVTITSFKSEDVRFPVSVAMQSLDWLADRPLFENIYWRLTLVVHASSERI